jgi:hypothetical protein
MTALELTALALVSRLLEAEESRASTSSAALRHAQDDIVRASEDAAAAGQQAICHGERVEPRPSNVEATLPDPQTFLTDSAGDGAHYYRAADESGEVLAGFYADGRVRLADETHRLAGIVQNGRADLLEIADNTWSELFVRVSPEGRLQLELRGGPYDARVFTCEPFDVKVNA